MALVSDAPKSRQFRLLQRHITPVGRVERVRVVLLSNYFLIGDPHISSSQTASLCGKIGGISATLENIRVSLPSVVGPALREMDVR